MRGPRRRCHARAVEMIHFHIYETECETVTLRVYIYGVCIT